MYILHTYPASNLITNLSTFLGAKLKQITINSFSNQEFFINIPYCKEKVLIEFPHSQSVNDSIIQLMLILESLSRYPIDDLNLLVPYMPYCRQDKINQVGDSFGIKVFADILNTFNLKKIITFDLHSKDSVQLFKANLINLTPDILFSSILANHHNNATIISPDEGGYYRAKLVADLLQLDLISCRKKRSDYFLKHHIGKKPQNPNIVIIDDILDSGETLISLVDSLTKYHINSIYIYVTHILGNGDKFINNLNSLLINKKIMNIYYINSNKKNNNNLLTQFDPSKIIEKYI